MRITVGHKLFLAFLTVMVLTVAGMILFMSWSFERGFVQYVEARQQARIETLANKLAKVYLAENGWSRLVANPPRWRRLLTEDLEDFSRAPRDESNWGASGNGAADANHTPVEYDGSGGQRGEPPPPPTRRHGGPGDRRPPPPREFGAPNGRPPPPGAHDDQGFRPPPPGAHDDQGFRPPPPPGAYDGQSFRPPPPPRAYDDQSFRPPPPPRAYDDQSFRPPPPPDGYEGDALRPPPPAPPASLAPTTGAASATPDASSRDEARREAPPPRRHPPPPLRLEQRMMLLDEARGLLIGRQEDVEKLELTPIYADGRVLGYLGVLPGPLLHDKVELRFMQRTTQAFLFIALVMLALSALVAAPLARRLVKPLRAVAEASRALSKGQYATRVEVASGDELGRLAEDFNELAMTLERNENLRRQWVADISHELRTPLAVLRAELEALRDGVRPVTPEAVSSLHHEVLRLARLINDLYELSMSDIGALSYRKTATDAVALLDDDLDGMADAFAHKRIRVEFNAPPEGSAPLVMADPERLSQLFRNLMTNCLRYTDAGGCLRVRAAREGLSLVLYFEDSAPAVPEGDLGRLFERFYRVEASRNRASGGAGLGLAICRNIVEAHEGRIGAAASELGGLMVRIEFPILRGER